jgi:co-chaperonin GroES (HSP10)
MFRAINKFIVVEMVETQTTSSGIIVSSQSNEQTREVKVIQTTDITEALQGQTIICPRHKLYEIGQEEGKKYGVINVDEILAIKD